MVVGILCEDVNCKVRGECDYTYRIIFVLRVFRFFFFINLLYVIVSHDCEHCELTGCVLLLLAASLKCY